MKKINAVDSIKQPIITEKTLMLSSSTELNSSMSPAEKTSQ